MGLVYNVFTGNFDYLNAADGSGFWKDPVANFAALPTGTAIGEVRITLDTLFMYVWNGSAWVLDPTEVSIGTIDSASKSANGAVISSNQLIFQTADSSFPGLVSTIGQTFAGQKTFTTAPILDSLTVNNVLYVNGSKVITGENQLALSRGGTNTNLTAVQGGISYGTSTGFGFSAAGTSGQLLQSNGTSAPSWINSTSTGLIQSVTDTNSIDLTVLSNALSADVRRSGSTLAEDGSGIKVADGGILNLQVGAAAAIARSKLASGTASHVLINDGSGVMSSEAQLAISRGGTGLSSLGSANRLLGVNSGATALEYKSLATMSSSQFAIGSTIYNGCVSIDNPDATNTYAALVVKHGDGLGNHQNILEVKDQTAITNYFLIDQNGQVVAQNITMENLFGETILQLNDVSSGASMGFGTSFTDPGVPSDGFKFFANPYGGTPTWVTSAPNYLGFLLDNAGTDALNTTYIGVSDYNAAGAIFQVVGEYNIQPCLNKRLGVGLTTTATASTPFNTCGAANSGARFTGSTAFEVRGLLAPDSTYTSTGRSGSLFHVRNDSSAIGVFKHENASATAADRMTLPGGVDFYLMPQCGATFSYNSGTSRFILVESTQPPSGVWTPTATDVANIAAKTLYKCHYSYNGKTVKFSGKISIDPSAANTLTQLRITKPIASNFAAEEDAAGVGFSDDVFGLGFRIYADATNDELMISYISDGTAANSDFSFSGSYEVI